MMDGYADAMGKKSDKKTAKDRTNFGIRNISEEIN